MPVKVLLGQPIKLLPYHEPRQCQVGDDPCYMHQPTDPVRMQFKQISFGPPAGSCAPQFQTLGDEVLSNGDFAGSATDWVLVNATYGSDKVCFNGSPVATVTQSVVLDASVFYKFLFVVSGITTGTMVLSAGGTALMSVTEDGTYTLYAHPGLFNDVVLSTSDSCDGCIESISVKQLFPCWDYDNVDFVPTFNSQTFGNKITHTPGSATTFTAANAMAQGGYYQCQIRVQGRTQGSVQMFAGDADNISTAITQNGIFTQFLIGNQTGASVGDPIDFLFTMDADFDGTIEYLYTFVLRRDFICTLLDTDGVPIADLSSNLIYSDDYVTLSFSGLNSITGFDGNPVPYGCYKIALSDRDGTNYVVHGDFPIDDPDAEWTEFGYFTGGIAGNQINAVSDGSAETNNQFYQSGASTLEEGQWYVASFRYKANFINAGNIIRMESGGTVVGSVNNILTTWQTFTSEPFQIVSSAIVAANLFATFGDDTAGNTISIDDVQIFVVNEYESNCISYQLSFPGTYSVIGQGKNIARSFGFGFLFQPANLYVFFFFQRLKVAFRKPIYPDKYVDGEYSNGTHYKSFASSEKVYEVVFEETGEIQHDCIALMIQCPRFFIAGNTPFAFNILDQNRYHCLTETYKPEWDELGANKLAPSIIQVQHNTDILKISNA